MPRAIWAGAISLGMVSIPVRLFPATRKRDLRFRELDRVTGQRVRHERVRHEAPYEQAPYEPPATSPRGRVADLVFEPPLAREVAPDDVVKGYEVLAPPGSSALAGSALTDRERQMARLLVQTLSGPFDPAQFRDEYRERVLQMIGERAAQAVEVAEPAPEPTPSSVEDLLTALKASIEQAKAQKSDRRRARGA